MTWSYDSSSVFFRRPKCLFLAEEPQCGHSGSVSCSPRSVVCDHTIDESLHLHGPRDSRKRCSKRPLSTCLFLADAGGNLNPELTRPAVNRKYVFKKDRFRDYSFGKWKWQVSAAGTNRKSFQVSSRCFFSSRHELKSRHK